MTASGFTAIRQGVDRQVLRIQGRLDSERSDRFLPWFFAGVFAVLFGLLHAAQNRSLEPGSGLAPWLQALWRRENGWAGIPMGGTDPAAGSPISEVVLQIGRQTDPEILFTVVQAVAIGLAVVPLWRLARNEAHLRVGATCVIVIVYGLAPTLHRANLGGFHPELLAVPAVLEALRRGLERRWWRFGAMVALILVCRADLGLTVAAIGIFLATMGRRRAGGITIAIGIVWSMVALVLVDPGLPSRRLTPADEFVARSSGPLGAIADVVREPFATLGALFSEPAVGFLVLILAPLVFLPMVSPRRLLMALPGLMLAMVTDERVHRQAERGVLDLAPAAAHIGPVVAIVFFALVFALERVGVPSVARVNVDRRLLLALLTGAVLLFVVESPTSPYRHPWTWGGRDAADGARLAVAEIVPGEVSIAVSPSMSALLAARPEIVELPPDPAALSDARIDRVTERVAYIVLDTASDSDGADLGVWDDDSRAETLERFAEAGFTPADRVGDVFVLVPGARSADPGEP